VNCEDNSLLVKAHPMGPTCHTGNRTCFFRELRVDKSEAVRR